MTQKNTLKLFDDKKVRTAWDDELEKWYFSIIDVIEVLTNSPRARKYWNALKTKLIAEGSELSHNLGQLKMQAVSDHFVDVNKMIQLIYNLHPRVKPFFGGVGL